MHASVARAVCLPASPGVGRVVKAVVYLLGSSADGCSVLRLLPDWLTGQGALASQEWSTSAERFALTAALLVPMQLYGLDYVGLDSFCKARVTSNSPAGYRYAGAGDSCIPIRNFSTLHESFLTVFQLMIGEDLDVIMYQTIALSSEWSFIFFVAWTLISVWILSNMFLSLRELASSKH